MLQAMPSKEGNLQLAEHRQNAAKLFCLLFPVKIQDEFQGLVDAGKVAKDGDGLLIVINHYSLLDGPAAFMYVASKIPTMLDRPWLAPTARHISDVTKLLNQMFGTQIDIKPIVTRSTLRKQKFVNHQLNDGLFAYLRGAAKTFKDGGIVVLAPQGTRMPYLKEPGGYDIAMKSLMELTTRMGVNNIGVLPVGLGLSGVKDYTGYSGLNVRRQHEVIVGPLAMKNSDPDITTQPDLWAFGQLKKLVPENYLKIPPSGVIYSRGN